MSPYTRFDNNSGVVRRSKWDVSHYASKKELIEAVRVRRYHLLECGDQFIVFCNDGEIRIHC